MFKSLFVVIALLFSTQYAVAAPPKPNTFVPNRGLKPSKLLALNMKRGISDRVKRMIYIWNKTYSDPVRQISDLMVLFRTLSDSPVMPKQLLENEEFELYRVVNTKKMIKALDRFQKDTNKTYKSLFDYSSYVIGSKDGDYNKAYKLVKKDMRRMVNSYNHLASVSNKQFRRKVMPMYSLNQKKKGISQWFK